MVLLMTVLATGFLCAQQTLPPLTVEQSRALALKVNAAQGQFIDIHEAFFSLINNTTTVVNFSSFVQKLDALGKTFRAFDPDIKRAESSKDVKVSRLGKALGLHLTRVRAAADKLRIIALELSKKAKDPDYYDANQYARDIGEYEAKRESIGETGKELNQAFKALP